jgi:RsiW-degrading membrane proteinase PrsW (M82 family)
MVKGRYVLSLSVIVNLQAWGHEMHETPWTFMLLIAAIPVLAFLLFFTLVRRDREKLPWERRATYLAYGILAILLVSVVLGKFIFH